MLTPLHPPTLPLSENQPLLLPDTFFTRANLHTPSAVRRNEHGTNSTRRHEDEDNTEFSQDRAAEGDAGGRLYQERTPVHPQTSCGEAPAARDELPQETGPPLPPAAGSYSFTVSGGDGYRVSQEGVNDTASTSDTSATTGPNANANAKLHEHSATPLASALAEAGGDREARAGVAAGSVDGSDGDGTPVRREPELLYAINFTVAPPREGAEPMQLSAEVSRSLSCHRGALISVN